MKEIVIISGKGGTGKTSITAAFAALANKEAVLADCDVDAADMHLLLAPTARHTHPFYSGHRAEIVAANCSQCGKCVPLCRFDAITSGPDIKIIPSACEGCGVCVHECPQNAITFNEQRCGEWYQSDTRFGSLVHARLDIGAENSGKLVSLVRKEARNLALAEQRELILVDGPPGIGCPVIASITGADVVCIITEPTCSGQHDLQRLLALTKHFEIPTFLTVNKWDINPEMTATIQQEALKQGVKLLGTIPYDSEVTAAQVAAQTVVERGDNSAALAITVAWNNLYKHLKLINTTP
ncbi:MAG: (4Fe-4S)-binding protein [Desulfobacteraceae bacterium 4572_35.2]|nr:MAG: (4Fe-4S)-binding protein [Desulfobacteraceae bacterium 4572_35.2]